MGILSPSWQSGTAKQGECDAGALGAALKKNRRESRAFIKSRRKQMVTVKQLFREPEKMCIRDRCYLDYWIFPRKSSIWGVFAMAN